MSLPAEVDLPSHFGRRRPDGGAARGRYIDDAGTELAAEVPEDGKRVKVLVVDDHVMFAESLLIALSRYPDIEVGGVAPDAATAISMVVELVPDVAILDYQLPDLPGRDLARRLMEIEPDLKMVMLTASATEMTVRSSLESGCVGFVTKDQRICDVVHAVREAASGRPYIGPPAFMRLLPGYRSVGASPRLSFRELQVLEMISVGMSGPMIAAHLNLSIHTVRNHTSRILAKLGAHSRVEAVAKARRMQLIGDSIA